ncbi:uncharacterized protein LAESUDRAFT_725298 [Laetiporus sulphureus 93-53]|uniref:Uncharacterized protein n=1 Tax=Laetiporus sulphureus 93-53 TaxID=1314785 RepID=A0A165EG21_9APHY|nr:uncharacterized protein LAESUDRAFT_725298 [Laetiporus sulphureus 93-53]KZT06984.1 hypothetical protein LAESUDRAFT_725298 [Laetiporus sulphureus 93-53]
MAALSGSSNYYYYIPASALSPSPKPTRQRTHPPVAPSQRTAYTRAPQRPRAATANVSASGAHLKWLTSNPLLGLPPSSASSPPESRPTSSRYHAPRIGL